MSLTQILVMIAAILPTVIGAGAASLAGYIRTDGWNLYVNEGIAGAFILFSAIATVLASGKLTGNWNTDTATVQATIGVLISGGACRPLMLWFQSNTRTSAAASATAPSSSSQTPASSSLPAGWSTLSGSNNDTSG